MKLFAREKAAPDPSIFDEIEHTRREIENAYTNFQNACDPDLIDSYIFEGNAAWKRYRFLLKQIRQS